MPTFRTNGIDLYYEERGSGEPLLLIMGITAAGAAWERHVSYWEKDFRCIVVDNRGVGFSDKPIGPYTTAQMADDYAGLLDALRLKNVRVVGCSMGSTIAQQLAILHPDKVGSLVLMCTWARCDNIAKATFEHMVDCKARLRPEEFSLFIQLLIYSKSSWDNNKVFEELKDARGEAAVEPYPQPLHALEAQASACASHNVLDKLGKIKIPTLVLGGREDKFTPVWMAEETTAGIPNAQLHLFEKSGHAFHWENIEDFNPRVRDWLLNL